jgi:hypothetical protein
MEWIQIEKVKNIEQVYKYKIQTKKLIVNDNIDKVFPSFETIYEIFCWSKELEDCWA